MKPQFSDLVKVDTLAECVLFFNTKFDSEVGISIWKIGWKLISFQETK